MSASSVNFTLNISAARYLRYYQGRARHVIVTAHDGRRVQFPAEYLRPFVTHNGICGEFLLRFDEQMRFRDLHRIR